MVVYNLACDNTHTFEGWFVSPEAFGVQVKTESVSCPICGSIGVVRQPSAPHIGKRIADANQSQNAPPPHEAVRALRAKVIDYILKNSEDVGKAFPEEARRIHNREAPERAIRGQATSQQAKELSEEGIEVLALPIARIAPGQLH